MTNRALSRVWGNPAAPTYKKRCIRKITAGGQDTLVHADIMDLAAQLAEKIQAPLEGWKYPSKGEDDHPRHYGIALRGIEGGPIPGAEEYGFQRGEDGWYVFAGTPETARELTEHVEAERMQARVANEQKLPTEWGTERPGQRELEPGMKGDDVLFFQVVYNAPEQSGVYDEWCTGMAAVLQHRWGHPVTGRVTADTWNGILPTAMTYSTGYGESGHVVRVFQAALYAYDWDEEVRVTGRFDEITHRALRKLQADYGLRQNSDVSAAEWTILLGRPPRNVTP